MNKQVKPRVSRRICDYFIVGGCGDEITLSCEEKQLKGFPVPAGLLPPSTAKHSTTAAVTSAAALDEVLALSFDAVVIDKYPVLDHQV